jgi:hypothetical protein
MVNLPAKPKLDKPESVEAERTVPELKTTEIIKPEIALK